MTFKKADEKASGSGSIITKLAAKLAGKRKAVQFRAEQLDVDIDDDVDRTKKIKRVGSIVADMVPGESEKKTIDLTDE